MADKGGELKTARGIAPHRVEVRLHHDAGLLHALNPGVCLLELLPLLRGQAQHALARAFLRCACVRLRHSPRRTRPAARAHLRGGPPARAR